MLLYSCGRYRGLIMSSTHNILSKMNAKVRDSSNDLDKQVKSEQNNIEAADQKPGMQPSQSMDEILRQALTMGKPAPKPQSK